MHPILQALWTQHGAASFEKQLHLGTLIEGLDWTVDYLDGLARFGTQHVWRIQLLGSEAEGPGTWRWAWANTDLALPEEATLAARSLRAFGEQRGVPELTSPEVALAEGLGHRMGLLATGALEAQGYLVLPCAGGAAYALVQDPSFPSRASGDVRHLMTVFPRFLGLREVEARKAWRHYLRYHGLEVLEQGARIQGRGAQGTVTATFDAQGRLDGLASDDVS